MLNAARQSEPMDATDETRTSHQSATILTTDGRLYRAGVEDRERTRLKRHIGRVTRDIGAEAGMAARRSVEVWAELRRVLGPDAGART